MVYVNYIDETHAVDLIEMPDEIGPKHIKYHYVLTCIDIFSKYGWCIALPNKKKETLINALEYIWKIRKPIKVWSDHESGLYSKQCLRFL